MAMFGDENDAAAVRDKDDLQQAEYQRLVEQGQEAARSQWTLGDLALQVEVRYGERNLQQYADDIGVAHRTLAWFRTIARAYPESSRQPSLSFTVHARAPAFFQVDWLVT